MRPFIACLMLLATVSLSSGCKEKPEIPRKHLEELINSGLVGKARKEIRALFSIQNLKNSTPLSRVSNPRRLIRGGLDGNTIAWVEDRFLFYWLDKNFEKLELDEFVPNGMAISRSGRYVLLSQKTSSGKECRLHPVSLLKKEIIDIDLKADCGHTPAISDDGNLIYYVRGGRLHYRSLKPLQIGQIRSPKFKPRYKKIPTFFHARDLPGDGIFIFHGSAGYYKAFHMPSISAGVRYLGQGFSAPELYGTGTAPEFIAGTPSSGAPGKTDKDKTDQKETPKAAQKPKTAPADASLDFTYLYSGGAARRKLHSFQPAGGRIRAVRALSYSPSLIHLTGSDKFLLLKKGQLHLMSADGRVQALPMFAKRFFVFRKGLVFEDVSNRLYFRRVPFTANELLLLKLQNAARSRR